MSVSLSWHTHTYMPSPSSSYRCTNVFPSHSTHGKNLSSFIPQTQFYLHSQYFLLRFLNCNLFSVFISQCAYSSSFYNYHRLRKDKKWTFPANYIYISLSIYQSNFLCICVSVCVYKYLVWGNFRSMGYFKIQRNPLYFSPNSLNGSPLHNYNLLSQ